MNPFMKKSITIALAALAIGAGSLKAQDYDFQQEFRFQEQERQMERLQRQQEIMQQHERNREHYRNSGYEYHGVEDGSFYMNRRR